MRQVIVQVASPHGPLVCDAARQVGAINISCTSATDVDGHALDVVLLHVSNTRLGDFVSALDSVPEPRVSMIPSGALALRPPADEVADQVIDVAPSCYGDRWRVTSARS